MLAKPFNATVTAPLMLPVKFTLTVYVVALTGVTEATEEPAPVAVKDVALTPVTASLNVTVNGTDVPLAAPALKLATVGGVVSTGVVAARSTT